MSPGAVMKTVVRDWLALVKRSGREFFKDEGPRYAAALSYYTVFALGPLLALLVLLAGVIWDPKDVQGAIEVQIRDLIGPEASREVLAMVAHRDPTGGQWTLAPIAGLGILI